MLKSYNPANGQYIGQVPITTAEKLPELIEKGKLAQKEWEKLDLNLRMEYLKKAAAKLGEQSTEISTLLSKEMGKNLKRSTEEIQECVHGTATMVEHIKKALSPMVNNDYDFQVRTEFSPLGVCGIITPWNYPVSMGHLMIIPALMAGNAVILKPSSETPLVAQAYVDCFNEILPPNLLQVAHGSLGNELVKSKVDFIGFTGSIEVGKSIMKGCADSLKRLVMELGGKDPLIVMKDADLDKAAKFAVANSLENAGQMCTATERIYVDENVAQEFENRVLHYVSKYKVGSYEDPLAWVGPIIHEKQRKVILSHIEEAVNKGAKILYGDQNHPSHFVNPTVLTNIDETMVISIEETFGPVICISHYKDIENAIALANDTRFGLGASVFGKDQAESVARRLEAGMIGINTSEEGPGDFPFVGIKESGFGFHGSQDGHRQFAQTRVFRINNN